MVGEIRFRFTRYLYKLYWEYFEHGELGEDSIQILTESCDIVNDNINVPLAYFNVLSSNFTRESMSYFLKVKDMPIIGKYATNLLVNRLYEAYEITTAFIEAAEEAIHIFEHSFPLNTEHLNYVLGEVKDNVEQAVNYVAQL